MRRLLMVVVLSAYACASTYYVSSSAGSDSNSGTSAGAAWKTLGKVNSGTFVAGDRILLARGDVWRETLTPPSSGANGNPIVFDAYGSGAAPEITAYQALPSWTQVSANLWTAPVTASGMNYVLFGTIWGTKQTTQGAVAHDRDFFLFSNTLYVYAPSNPTTYYGTVAAILLTNSQLIYVNGKSWLTFQHIKVDWFDQFGVNVAGASDHLVFANMEADGMVPAGTMPLGFYVNAASPGDLKFMNVDAHLNYDGFRIDGAASAIKLVNCKGYANRDGGLVDNTGGHATYSYSHFYANNIAIVNSQDVQGAIDGGDNLASDTSPAVVNFALYPARLTFTIDDLGEAPGTEAYVDTLVPEFDARNLKLSAAVSTGYPVNTADVQSWLNDGHDINSHSWSHQYYTNLTAMNLRYTGTGTAATVTISGNQLTTTVTGGPGGENLNIDLTNAAYSSMLQLVTYINGHGGYSATEGSGLRDAVHTVGLADVTAHDIKTSYGLQFDKQRLVTDEMTASKAWLQTNLTSLGNVKVYVYPDGIEDATTEGYAVTAGYEGARGGLSMGLGSNAVYSKGVNLQNIVSLGVAGFHGLTGAQIDAKVGALVFKAQAWGVPYGLFVHQNDLTAGEVGMVPDAIATHGGSVLTNTQLADWLHSAQNVAGTTNYVAPATGALNLRPTAPAPVVKGGSNQGVMYGKDLLGASRPVPVSAAWDIGAYEILWTKHGGASGAGHFTMGATTGTGTGENAYCGPGDVPAFGVSDATAALPQQCVYTAMAGTPSPGTVHTVASNCSDLQTQINNAAAGDTIVIPATATCVGSYTLPAKTGADANHWTTIRTDQIGNPAFTPEGSRTTPCMIAVASIPGYPNYPCSSPTVLMPTISNNVTNGSAIAVSGNFYRLIGLNLTKQTGTNMFYGTLLNLGGADHVICDRCLIHGSDNLDMLTKAGVSSRGTYLAIINSWIYNIDLNSPDGYCISGGTGTQSDEMLPKLYNNLLACASETWLFGGGSVVAVPHDGEFRRNLSMKPLTWMLPIGANGTQNEPGPAGVNVKNLGEFKIGQRVLIEGNTYWQNWMGQSDQWGPVMGFAPKNQASVSNAKYVNVSGTTVTCAENTGGTLCAAGAGVFAFNIANVARANGVVTIHTVSNGAAWTNGWDPPAHIVVQGMPLIGAAGGTTRTAASCSQADVQAKINLSSDGDTVLVPSSGTPCTWTTPSASTPTIALNKAITLQGATTCSGSPVTCTDGTIINDGTGNGFDENLIDINAAARVTGFSFRDPRSVNDAKPPIQLSCVGCRFDHNSMTQTNTSGNPPHGVYVYSSVSGTQLVDHNYFRDLNGATDVDGSAGGDAHYPGDVSWATALSPGSANAAYIEDNNFAYTAGTVLDGAFDAYAGARMVFRFNTVTNTNTGGHGLDSGGSRSVLLMEVYKNTATNNDTSNIYTWWNTRGGVDYIWGNTINSGGGSYGSFMWLQNYRSDSSPSPWGTCTGSNVIDQNTTSPTSQQGYACRDQVGRGPETAAASDWPVNASTPTFSEPLMPMYSFANLYKGAAPTASDINIAASGVSTTRVQTYHILNNRDFYMEGGTCSGATCSSGTGSGTLAARPGNCTTGVAYWATDQGSWNTSGGGGQGQLYKCTATNTWTLYYTPYTYPHPLQNAGGENLNGEYPMISPTSVIVFNKAGADFTQVSWTPPAGGLVTDFIASTCAPGGCRFAAPKATGTLHINSVISSEQITTVETQSTLTGATHQTCHPGQAFNAQVRDITIRYNRISHGAGVGIGQNNIGSDCSDEALGVSNFSVHDNVADDIDGAFWNNGRNSCCGGGGVGTFTTTSNVYTTPAKWPHDVSIFHNTAVGMRGWPGSGSIVGGFGSMYAGYAPTYFANYTMRDNISLAPYRVGANVAAGLAANACDPANPTTCTWTFTKNVLATAVYAGYGQPSTAPYPATNQTCGTGSATCFPADFTGMFVNWGNGLGDIASNDYHLVSASPYKGQATDGKDLGADIDKVTQITGGLPTFTYPAITIANSSLTACTNGVYCEQQLYLATGAGALWVRWKITSGTLPTGMTFTGYSDGTGTGIGAGGWRGGSYGNAGWLWGTPTQSGSFPLTFQAEDAAHQKTSVPLTLVVN